MINCLFKEISYQLELTHQLAMNRLNIQIKHMHRSQAKLYSIHRNSSPTDKLVPKCVFIIYFELKERDILILWLVLECWALFPYRVKSVVLHCLSFEGLRVRERLQQGYFYERVDEIRIIIQFGDLLTAQHCHLDALRARWSTAISQACLRFQNISTLIFFKETMVDKHVFIVCLVVKSYNLGTSGPPRDRVIVWRIYS